MVLPKKHNHPQNCTKCPILQASTLQSHTGYWQCQGETNARNSNRTQSQPKRPPMPTAHRLPQGDPALATKHPQPQTGQRTSPACPPDDSINARPHKARSSASAPQRSTRVLLPDRLGEERRHNAAPPARDPPRMTIAFEPRKAQTRMCHCRRETHTPPHDRDHERPRLID